MEAGESSLTVTMTCLKSIHTKDFIANYIFVVYITIVQNLTTAVTVWQDHITQRT